VNRREFLVGAAALPVAMALGPRVGIARAAGTPHALVTADLESHVVALELASGEVIRRIRTGPGPRSIESGGRRLAVVAHTQHGVVSLLGGARLDVWKELDVFTEPRYAAVHPSQAIAYVTDSKSRQVVAVDLEHGLVVWRVDVPGPARHVSISADGDTVWTALGSTAPKLAVLDTSAPRRPRLVRTIVPPFLAHDVVFAPDGRSIWVTSGSVRKIALYPPDSERPRRLIEADAPPQHIAFGRGEVYVPLDSYNVTFGWGSAVTPSLGRGTVSVLDGEGRLRRVRRIAKAAHDACIVYVA
jgi:hypothetical protein